MQCRSMQDLLYAYVCGALSPTLQRQVREHLDSGCRECAQRLEAIRQRLQRFQPPDAHVAPELSARDILLQARRRILWWRALAWGVMGLVLLGILAVGWLIARYRYEHLLLEELTKAVFVYRLHTGRYPPADRPLGATLKTVPATRAYLRAWHARLNPAGELLDYWGTPLCYRCPGRHNAGLFDIHSYGLDGKDDGGRWDDIKNWHPAAPGK